MTEPTSPEVILIQAAQWPLGKLDPETHLLLAGLEERGIRAIVRPWNTKDVVWRDIPLVVVRTPWDYFEKPDEFLAWAAMVAHSTRLINPYEVLQWNIHKGYILDLERRGIPIVPTRLLRAADVDVHAVTSLTALGFAGDTIVKPAHSVGAIGLQRGGAGSLTLDAHAHELLAAGHDVLVQAFVPSVQATGEVSLVFFDGTFSHAVRKVPKAGDFRVQDHHGGTVVPHEATEVEVRVARRAVRAAPGRTAYARVDLVEKDGEMVVMELELIEPELFLRYSEQGLRTFVDYIVALLRVTA